MTRRSIVAVSLLALMSGACGGSVSDEYEVEQQPYSLEPVEGNDDVLRVVLTEDAVAHVGIETVPVERRGSMLVIPYDAVFLDAHGAFWVYTNPEPLEFVRAPIEIARETSTRAFLTDGPPEGTEIVVVGVPELYGSETEFDA
jgi:hypothetical protein